MAVLETIRVKLGILITVLIAVALLSFIIDPSTLQSVSSSMSSKYDVGEIDGKSISYNDYQADVDRFTTINEILTGGSAQNEQQQISIRNAAWQSLVDKYLFVKNAEKAGIHVGEEELLSMISGDLESPVFTQNPAFFDENGNFSKNMVLEFVSYMNSDQTGRLPIYWNWLQESAKTQQYYAKYNSLFTASNFANTLAVANQIAENNNTFNVEFVMLPMGYAQDSTIVVSDSEIKKYYDDHKKFYRQPASRDIEYVVYEVVPSAEDIEAANESLVKVYDEFAAAENIKSFLLANSDRQYDSRWYKEGELNSVHKDVNDYAFGKNEGVSPVIANGNTFYAVRVMEEAMVPDSVYVKYAPSTAENVDSVLNAAEAMWIPQIAGFEDVMTAEKNSKVTVNGMVFNVLDRTAPVAKKRVAVLEKTAVPSKETVNGFYSKANTLATKSAGKYDEFVKAVAEESAYAHPNNTAAPAPASSHLGWVPATNIITTATIPMSIMAERCFSSASGTRIPMSATPKPSTPKRNSFARCPKVRVNRAKSRIIVNFAISDGWNCIPARLIQRFAPLTSSPITSTLRSSTILTPYSGHAARYHTAAGSLLKKYIAANPIAAHSACFCK